MALLSAYGAFAYMYSTWPFESRNVSPNSRKTNDSGIQSKSDKPNGDRNEDAPIASPSSPKTPTSNETGMGEPPKDYVKLVARITTARQTEHGGTLQIRTIIEGVTNNGSCSLKLTRGNNSVQRKVGIQALPNSSTCKGFDIPADELAAGTWYLVLTISSDDQVVTLTKDVTITK